jgi:hypothetical protein
MLKRIKFNIKKRRKFIRFFGDNLNHTCNKDTQETQSFSTDKPTREEFVIFRERTNASLEKMLSGIVSLEKMMENMMNQAKEDRVTFSKEIKEDRVTFSKEIKELQMFQSRATALASFVIAVVSILFYVARLSDLWIQRTNEHSADEISNETKKIQSRTPENEKPK